MGETEPLDALRLQKLILINASCLNFHAMSCRRFGPELVANGMVPDYALNSQVAPPGMVFNTGNGLPAQHNGGAFVGELDSWDRSPLNV